MALSANDFRLVITLFLKRVDSVIALGNIIRHNVYSETDLRVIEEADLKLRTVQQLVEGWFVDGVSAETEIF